MSTIAEVRLWGTRIGAVSLGDGERVAAFEYEADFARRGIEVAPLQMPLSRQVYRFPGLAPATFHGLPGLLADSLPDRFGHAVIDSWLARQGRPPDSLNAVERLCYTGARGMGGLEFRPATGPDPQDSVRLEVDRLVELASEVLARRRDLGTRIGGGGTGDDREAAAAAMEDILRVGTSAGGARAKAVIAWNPASGEVRSGQVPAGAGFEYWLLKFDGVSGNRDRELDDPQGYGLIEYAYALMAGAAGITMAPCRILAEGGRHHFMTRRFDRRADGDKVHMQSLGALAHLDYNQPGAHGYEDALLVMRQLALPKAEVEELFRRMVFNVVARNQDDHVKNIAFLMDRRGRWSLAPAFDLTFSYNPEGAWTNAHQMTLNGKRDGFTRDDFKACARAAALVRGRAGAIIAEVEEAARRWPEFAAAAGVPEERAEAVRRALRLRVV